jgi:ABC-type sugar transport system ATPase subunit
MNFLPCHFVAEENVLQGASFVRKVPPEYRDRLRQPRENGIMLGIRPENLLVQLEPGEGALPARVYIAEPMGRENLLTLQVGGSMVKAMAPPEVRPAIGQDVWLAFDDRAVRLFDQKTENAIPPDSGSSG